MPLVNLYSNASNHGLEVMPANRQQRIWLVPNRGHIVPAGGALDNIGVLCAFNHSTGDFNADVWSEGPDLWYYLRTDWLVVPGDTEEGARGFYQWDTRIYPDTGGDIGDLIEQQFGLGLVYCAYDAPNPARRNQLHYNIGSADLFERVLTWLP